MKESLNDPPPSKPHKPYDWEGAPDDDMWGTPITAHEAKFWRGVWVGAIIEGIVIVILIALFWGLL